MINFQWLIVILQIVLVVLRHTGHYKYLQISFSPSLFCSKIIKQLGQTKTTFQLFFYFNTSITIGHKKSATFLVAYSRKPDQRPTPKAKGMPTPENVGISTLLSLGVEKIGRIFENGKI